MMNYIKLFESFNSIQDLINILKQHNIPIEKWGLGQSKTIEHLFKELQDGECRLEYENKELVRYIDFVGIKVFYKDMFLIEDHQEFKDGRIRKRNTKFSVAEKMKPGEIPLVSVIRGMQEELGIEISENQITSENIINHEGIYSRSYPGLKAKYNEYPFTCHINNSQFNPDGYTEIQKDKSTFFKWIKM